ncbi:MAG: hypothetical protein IPO67_00260 [Deltaproteobacteria bacterium]|nr:hypothetical protein [Deltaproteobacteria bacterium]
MPLGDLSFTQGGAQEMGEIGSESAYSEGEAKSAGPMNDVSAVHEAAHHVQRLKNGVAPGETTPDHPAELEAQAVAQAFEQGKPAPEIRQKAPALARDEEGGTPLEQLRRASQGNWIGDVDETECLRLINQLPPGDKVTARDDQTLMGALAGAFNAQEMLTAVNALGMNLAWKVYWLQRAGGGGGAAAWQSLFATATESDLQQLLASDGLLNQARENFETSPLLLFARLLHSAQWTAALGRNRGLVEWILDACDANTAAQELGHATIADVAPIVGHLSDLGWSRLLDNLPKGSGLVAGTRAALRRFKDHADVSGAKLLFEHRFNHTLSGRYETADGEGTNWLGYMFSSGAREINWTVENIRAVWDELEFLPDQDVSDNTVLSAFQAISGDRGFWSGGDTIQLGEGLRTATWQPDRLGHTVRHEVGHAVHDQLAGTVNAWLQSSIGFWYSGGGRAGLESLINTLGGWPEKWTDSAGAEQDFGDDQKSAVLDMLEAHTGGSPSFTAATTLPDPAAPASDLDRQWAAMKPAVLSCFRLSANRWYDNYAAMPTGANGKYFWNHWYKKPYYFSGNAETAIVATGDNYSAMSEKEFFANCYAEYFEDEAGYTDHSLWGGSLNAPVKSFFASCIVDRQPYAPPDGTSTDGTAPGVSQANASGIQATG